jgi:hypothetical protein
MPACSTAGVRCANNRSTWPMLTSSSASKSSNSIGLLVSSTQRSDSNDSVSSSWRSSSKSLGFSRLETNHTVLPLRLLVSGLFLMVRWTTFRRCIGNVIATHVRFGRNCTQLDGFRKKMPTCTNSWVTGPRVAMNSLTTSNIGRSNSGPLAKYVLSVRAGAHSWDWPTRRKVRAHDSQVQVAVATRPD